MPHHEQNPIRNCIHHKVELVLAREAGATIPLPGEEWDSGRGRGGEHFGSEASIVLHRKLEGTEHTPLTCAQVAYPTSSLRWVGRKEGCGEEETNRTAAGRTHSPSVALGTAPSPPWDPCSVNSRVQELHFMHSQMHLDHQDSTNGICRMPAALCATPWLRPALCAQSGGAAANAL